MRINRTGCTRIVIELQRYVVKLPNFLGGWRLFLKGLLANMQETKFSRSEMPGLCPVTFSLPGGWAVVMQRARLMSRDEFLAFDADGFCEGEDFFLPVERKENSFGYIGGKIVAIDYGN